MAQMARQKTQDWKVLGLISGHARKEIHLFLFSVCCFGALPHSIWCINANTRGNNSHSYIVLIQIWCRQLKLHLIGWYKRDAMNWIVDPWSQLFQLDDVTWLDQDSRLRKIIGTLKLLKSLVCVVLVDTKLVRNVNFDKKKLENHSKGMATLKKSKSHIL